MDLKTAATERLLEIVEQLRAATLEDMYKLLGEASGVLDQLKTLSTPRQFFAATPPVMAEEVRGGVNDDRLEDAQALGVEARCRALTARVKELEDAVESTLSWVEIRHRPPVRDALECGKMVYVRLHALAALAEVCNKSRALIRPADENAAAEEPWNQLIEENAQLRKALAGEVCATTLLTSLATGPEGINAVFEGGVSQVMAGAFAEQFREKGGANYLELRFTAKDGLNLLVTLQKLDGKTPSQFRSEAEAGLAVAQKHIAQLQAAQQEGSDAAVSAARYRYVRTLNPRDFTELYRENISTGMHFDTLVDDRVALQLKLSSSRFS